MELGSDKQTGRGRWLLDPEDQQFIQRRPYPVKVMLFVCIGSGFKPYYELIEPIGRKEGCYVICSIYDIETQ